MQERTIISVLLILLLAGVPSVYSYPYSRNVYSYPYSTNVALALNWLRSQQKTDGSIGSFAISSWAVMAIASSYSDPGNWRKTDGSSVVQYLEGNVGLLSLCSDYSRFMLSMVAARTDPENITVGRVNMVTKLESFYNVTTNDFGGGSLLDDDFWAVMALVSAGVNATDPSIQNTLSFIKANQNTDHGWGWAVGQTSDVDDTAAAIMALISAGEPISSTYVTSGLSYMKAEQTDTGGFVSFGGGNSTSAETDSWAIQAIVAAGQNATSNNWTQNGKTPIDDLLAFQTSGGGFKDYTGSPDVWTTSYAIPALLGRPYPIASGARVSIRIEGQSATVWKGEVFVSWSNITDDKGDHYYYGQPTVLGALDEASRKAGFTYVVDYTYGVGEAYVTTINGEAGSGVNGWLFRVNNHTTGAYSADGFVLNKATTPPPPHTSVLWYYGGWAESVASISVNSTNVYSNQAFTATVTYLNETSGTWLPVEAATVHANGVTDSTYLTDANGQVSISIRFAGTYAIYAEKTGFVRTDKIPVTVIPVTVIVSYSIVGGGTPTAPLFHYFLNGVSKSLTLSKTPKTIVADAGTTWSVANPLGGSSSFERWYSNQPMTGTTSSTTIVFVFYHQYPLELSCSVMGGGSGYSAPTFTANQFGVPAPQLLPASTTTSPAPIWFDAGSPWTVSPNPLTGSNSNEEWVTAQATSGKVTGRSTMVFKFQNQFYLTMQMNPSGLGSISPKSGWYNAGQKVSITATAKTGYKFLSWAGSGTDSNSGTSGSETVTMNGPITETANFGVLITITSSPTGSGYVTVDGVAVKTPQTFAWVIGSTYTIAAISPVSCGTGCQYVFNAWSDAGAQSHVITVPSTPTTYKATFQKQYQLTITVNPSGHGTVNVASGWQNAGTKITPLTATANAGWIFKSWKGTGSGSYTGPENPATITMNSAITETANFT